MDILKRRGRPRSEHIKSHICYVRLDDKDMAKLVYVREKNGGSNAEILREGLRMQYNLTLFKD